VIVALAVSAYAEEPRRIALLVGDNDGGPGRPTLRYAHNDASAMAAVLQQLGGVQPDDALVLYDPTRAELMGTFDRIDLELEASHGEGEFVFYYSGHSDEHGLLLGDETLEYKELKDKLDSLPARVRLGILDSCASGTLILTKGGTAVPAFMQDESVQVDGSAYITSSADDEVSQEAERIGGSYFTHFLASGLRGAADATGDGRVTLDEAYGYAYDETLAQTEKTQGGPQHATRAFHLTGKGELVLTDLALTSASLVLDESLAGRALIRDDEGNLVVELRKIAGRSVELGLAEGRYTVTIVNGDDQYGLVTVALATAASTRVSLDQLVWRPADPTVTRGDVPDAVVSEVEPPPEPPQALIAPESPARTLWPRISVATGLPPAPVGEDTMVFSLVADKSQSLDGLAVAGAAYIVDHRTRGFVTALGVTTAGDLDGAVQLSMGANVAGTGGKGLQVTMGGNVVGGSLDGGQGTVGANVVGKDLRGAQLSVGGNVVAGAMKGVQATVGANWAGPGSEGLQASVGANWATSLRGAQISFVNIGGDVSGTQIGLVNIGRDVNGAQIGLVNVARSVHGVPFGLLSFEKEGRHDLLVYASESDVFNAELKFGGDYWHTIVGGGGTVGQAYAEFGFGATIPSGKLWIDLDAVQTAYVSTAGTTRITDEGPVSGPFSRPPTGVARVRAVAGFQVAKEFAPFGGVTMNVRIPGDYRLLDVAPAFLADGSDAEIVAWPGLVGGVQF
jgi:hypothetical protein